MHIFPLILADARHLSRTEVEDRRKEKLGTWLYHEARSMPAPFINIEISLVIKWSKANACFQSSYCDTHTDTDQVAL